MWHPTNQPPKNRGDVWVKWQSHGDSEIHASIGYWDGMDFCMTQAAYEYSCENYTFEYIGKVLGWQEVVPPEI